MKKNWLLAVILLAFSLAKAQDTLQYIVSNRRNSVAQQQKPYVILISADGFRYDFAEKYQAKNLLAFKALGVSADYMLSSFPSLTFPNHYTIVTGLYPAHHGIVGNIFYDKQRNVLFNKSDRKQSAEGSWYGGIPLWILAEQQGMLSAAYFWPGSETTIAGIKPTYYYTYNEITPLAKRINAVKDWLALPEDKRPHFIVFYFPQVDQTAHIFGPDSKETQSAVKMIDDAVGQIAAIAKESKLPVNFVFLSDHGMTKIDNQNTLALPKAIDPQKFKTIPGAALIQVYANEGVDLIKTYRALKSDTNNYRVYLHKRVPKQWHFGGKDDYCNRVGDIILIPKLPKVFSINGVIPAIGQHGFAPEISDMYAVFYAWGSQIKEGVGLNHFENVHVYPFIAEILGLSYKHKIDGRKSVLKPFLK